MGLFWLASDVLATVLALDTRTQTERYDTSFQDGCGRRGGHVAGYCESTETKIGTGTDNGVLSLCCKPKQAPKPTWTFDDSLPVSAPVPKPKPKPTLIEKSKLPKSTGDYEADYANAGGSSLMGEVCPSGQDMILKPRQSFFDQGKKVCCAGQVQAPTDGLPPFDVDCTDNKGLVYIGQCPQNAPEVFREGDQVCCLKAVAPKSKPKPKPLPLPPLPKPNDNGLPPFDVDCTNNLGSVFYMDCPSGFSPLFNENNDVCCVENPPPTPKPKPKPKPVPLPKPEIVSIDPNLDKFITDPCTAQGGVAWDRCHAGQVTLSRDPSGSCCGDPSPANRNEYILYAKQCFERSGTILINQKCEAGHRTILPVTQFGAIEPVVCCVY